MKPSARNFVAKHMNTYNRPSVVENKRQKWLDEQHAKQVDEWDEDAVYRDDEEGHYQC